MEQEVAGQIENIFSKIDAGVIVRSAIVIIIAVALFITVRVVFKKLKKKFAAEGDIKKSHNMMLIRRVINIVIALSAVLAVLQVNGVNITGFSLGIGTIVVIVSFALKDSLQDIVAGSVIMIDNFFKVGDAVEYEGRDGVVVFFSIRTTKIEYLDDRSVMSVSNRNISKIRKLTHLVDIDLPLSYDLPREKAYGVLSEICEKVRGLQGVESCELKGTQEFAESAIIYKIRFFCEPHDRPDVRRSVIRAIQDGLEAADVHVPYNQIDVHTK